MTDQDLFSTHADPVWRDRADFIINAKLPEPGRFEQLWARRASENTFELCCIPFFLYDAALGDIVETSEAFGRRYVLHRVVACSGRFVFRVHFEEAQKDFRDDVVLGLTEQGALVEWSSPTMFAVDARDAVHGQEIADYLFGQETRGRLVYETGRTA